MKLFLFSLILLNILTPGVRSEENLILYKINGTVPVVLVDDYGFMLVNDGDEETPIPRYIFADRANKIVTDTRDIDTYRKIVETVPENSLIYEYVSCSVPRWLGLTEGQKHHFYNLFSKFNVTIAKGLRVTCYCPE